MATPRMRRINEVLREVIGATIAELSVLGSEEEREATMAGLESSHGVIQSRIAAETRMKRTPTLSFRYDETVEQGIRISKLLEDEQ